MAFPILPFSTLADPEELIIVAALQTLEEDLTPIESLQASLNATITRAQDRAVWWWALEQLKMGMDKEVVPRWTLQNRPMRDTSKPANRNRRDETVIPAYGWWKQEKVRRALRS